MVMHAYALCSLPSVQRLRCFLLMFIQLHIAQQLVGTSAQICSTAAPQAWQQAGGARVWVPHSNRSSVARRVRRPTEAWVGEEGPGGVQDFLSRAGLVERSVLSVLAGLKEVLGNDSLAALTFKDFLLVWAWLVSTVEAMGASLPTSR